MSASSAIPKRLSRKTFTSRPRTEGLWIRLNFKDNEVLEGMMPNDLSLTTAEGFLINPPDLRSNIQRIFVPRSALESLTVLAVIGATHRRRKGTPTGHPAGADVWGVKEGRRQTSDFRPRIWDNRGLAEV